VIRKLDFSEKPILAEAYRIQKQAYEVEAQLIDSRNIPPLHESIEMLMNAQEVFYGCFKHEQLIGFVAIEQEGAYLRISRLVVNPLNFKEGFGKALVHFVLQHKPKEQSVIVSTGEANYPARLLYEKLNFTLQRIYKVDEVSIAEFIRR